METELQTTDLGTGETGAALATDTEGEQEQTPEGFVKADSAQHDINKQHKKFRDEERAHVKTRTEADGLRKELDEIKAQSVDLDIPPVPDPYAENYTELVKNRDEAIERSATHNVQQANQQVVADAKDKERVDQEKVTEAEQIAVFDSNMIKLGLTPAETNTAARTVLEYGVSDNLLDVLMEDSEGPLMVQYLASNPVEIETLNGLSTLQLVNRIEKEVRPKASLLKPKTSDAPDPPIILDGGGVKELEDTLPNGVKYQLE